MTDRVGKDSPTAIVHRAFEQRRAQSEYLLLRFVQVVDAEVEVKLLGIVRVRPARRLVVLRPLEGEYGPAGNVREGHPPIALRHYLAAEQLPVELGERHRFWAVQGDRLQLANHESVSLVRFVVCGVPNVRCGSAELRQFASRCFGNLPPGYDSR